MQYRKFGKTGCEVSALGFGAMRMPTCGQDNKIDEAKAIEMIRFAIDSGVNYVDTAFFYHGGESEKLVGKALRDGYRDRTYLATKLPMGEVKTAEDFDRLLSVQLERLGTDHIDFYLFHALNRDHWQTVMSLGLIDKMKKAKAEGKIRHYGFSFHDDLDVFKKIVDEYDGCEFCQIQLSYTDCDYQAGIEGLHYAGERNLGVVIMEPLNGGRHAKPADKIRELLPAGKSPVESALDFIWHQSEVSLLLSGMGELTQVKENIAYADKSHIGMMSDAELAAMANAKNQLDKMTLIPCTACRYCQPCPHGVEIPEIFAAYNLVDEGDRRLVKEKMPDIEDKISLCRKCGECEKKCPQHIEIIKKLHDIKDKF